MLSTTLILAGLLPFTTLAQSPRSKTCVISPAKGQEDQSPAILQAFQNCASNAVIVFTEGANYNVFTPIIFPVLTNVEIRVGGNLHLPKDIPTVQAAVNLRGVKMHWMSISGTNVDWIGSSNPNNGWIESYGQQWYDANPAGQAGLPNRPKLFMFKVTTGSIQYFKARKPIGWVVSLLGSNIKVSNAIIDAASTSSSFPFNTDGFAVNGDSITISDSHIFNGDDAITIHTGTHNFVFKNSVIGFQTHGMSIGSLGKDPATFEDISNVLFDGITVQGGLYASRFKSWVGGHGLVKNVTWSNIHMTNVTFPIFVTQTYQDQSVAPKPGVDQTQSVEMSGFTWSGFTGTINSKNPGDGSCLASPCWYYEGLKTVTHTEAVVIQCATGKCKNFAVKGMALKPDNGAAPSAICANVDKVANPTLGFNCVNGPMRRSRRM